MKPRIRDMILDSIFRPMTAQECIDEVWSQYGVQIPYELFTQIVKSLGSQVEVKEHDGETYYRKADQV